MITTYLFIILVVLFIGITCWAAYNEWKDYNRGVCPWCGNELKHMSTDSQGGRLYGCSNDECVYICWISYPIEKFCIRRKE